MASIFWKTIGNGNNDLIMLHGWALNSSVWTCIIPYLSSRFRLHLVDLPGYGKSYSYGSLTLDDMSEKIALQFPQNAFWLGWSLGGLIATKVAYKYPNIVSGLITVSFSPRFCASNDFWPGVKPEVLKNFLSRLNKNSHHTVNRFFSLQTKGTASSKQDARKLKNIYSSSPVKNEVLISGIDLLYKSDLRAILSRLNMPLLHLYGLLDNIVPNNVIPLIDRLNLSSQKVVFSNAGHVPFISHSELFCQVLSDFIQSNFEG
ncbi:pimeloyl-ACP methyl ester esterase BioH [Sodalis sp. CWE]|nr:pimeloyl-ACP methyl ester esterase BioH [Sodalis sp. CWE]